MGNSPEIEEPASRAGLIQQSLGHFDSSRKLPSQTVGEKSAKKFKPFACVPAQHPGSDTRHSQGETP
jgi:hypothetical protein